ncbi:MAG: hypothetical protein SF029_01315 [bacterium]|nr:hypothetical protein [bacterium]
MSPQSITPVKVRPYCTHSIFEGDIHVLKILEGSRVAFDQWLEGLTDLHEYWMAEQSTVPIRLMCDFALPNGGQVPVSYAMQRYRQWSATHAHQRKAYVVLLYNDKRVMGFVDLLLTSLRLSHTFRLFHVDHLDAALVWLKGSGISHR